MAHPLSRLALLFACYTGLQPADIESLQFDHIHHCGSGLMVVKPSAQRNSTIRVPLGRMAQDIFNQIRELYAALPRPLQDGYLFHSLDKETMNEDIRRWVVQAGLGRTVDLSVGRHTFCILALQSGVSQEELASWCGATLQTVSKYQPFAAPVHDKDIEAFDALFDKYFC